MLEDVRRRHERERRTGVRAAALAVAVVAYTACSTIQVSTDYARGTDFGRYRTFAIEKGTIVSQGLPDPHNTLVRDRIDRALRAGLLARGLAAAVGEPDVTVTYVAGARTRQELEHVDWGYPWGPFWGGPGYDDFWITEHQRGTLIIDFVDAGSEKLIWRALVVAEGQPFAEQAFIDKAVGKALDRYPPKADKNALETSSSVRM